MLPLSPIPTKQQNHVHDPTFNLRKYETHDFSINQVIQVKQAFDFFDKDKSGSLQLKEIQEAMQMLGFISEKEEDVALLIELMDGNGDKNLDFHEFMEIITANISKNDSDQDLKKVFQYFIDMGNNKFLEDDDEEEEIQEEEQNKYKLQVKGTNQQSGSGNVGNSTHKITIQMLRNIAKQLGENIDDEDLINMLDKADRDEDGKVGFNDFKTIIKWNKPRINHNEQSQNH